MAKYLFGAAYGPGGGYLGRDGDIGETGRGEGSLVSTFACFSAAGV